MLHLLKLYSHTFRMRRALLFALLVSFSTSFPEKDKKGVFKPSLVEDAFVLYRRSLFY